MSERLKVMLAIGVSALLHVLLAIILIAGTWLLPAKAIPDPVPELKTVEVTLQSVPLPTPEPLKAAPAPAPQQAATRSVLQTDGLAASEKPPDKPLFESDKDSTAGSDRPATGSAPLPSQEGIDKPFDHFKTQNYSVGPGTQPPVEMASAATPAPKPSIAPTPKAPTEERSLDSFPEEPKATPAPAPLFNPTPIPKPANSAFALGKPTPIPVPSKPPGTPAPPKPTPAPEVAMLETKPEPRPEQPRSEPGYQPQMEKTKIEGSISNRGRPGVDAIGTPLGRYRKKVADAIGSRWYRIVDERRDLIREGAVHINFVIDARGKVGSVKILSNTANATFGEVCMQSVTEAEIPAPPADVVSKLDEGRLEIDYNFTIY